MPKQETTEGFYKHVSEKIIRGPRPHDPPALSRTQPLRNASHTSRPSTRLHQSVEKHEHQERVEGIGKTKGHIARQGKAEPAKKKGAPAKKKVAEPEG